MEVGRIWADRVEGLLESFPAVALLGSRQAGKTTLARAIADARGEGQAVYLDLERPSHVARLAEAELFLGDRAGQLVVIDEVQRRPDLFPLLRSLIDEDARPGRFLLLGSASPDLLRQSSESLAGRLGFVDLPPLLLCEVEPGDAARPGEAWRSLWLRGGYPKSYLARSDALSFEWRDGFIRTFLERDLPQLGVRTPAARLLRFWQMLAHWHGQLWNASELARSFDVSQPTVGHYLDLLTDTFVVRQLRPLYVNLSKRLVRAPKVYLRDSGLLHSLLGLATVDDLAGHPSLGPSFEGFAINQIVDLLSPEAVASFYRTQTGVEADLVLDFGRRERLVIEVKYTSAPAVSRGLREALADLGRPPAWVVTPASETFPIGEGITAISLAGLIRTEILPRWRRASSPPGARRRPG